MKYDVEIKTVTLEELKAAHEGKNGTFLLEIPRYQRGIVWTEKQKEMLLESISSGYPVGSLLAFQTPKTTQKGNAPLVWQLVDGLQRTSTLIQYMESPFTVAGMNAFLKQEDVDAFARQLYENPNQTEVHKVKNLLETWLKVVVRPDVNAGYQNTKLYQFFKENLTDCDVLQNGDVQLELLSYIQLSILEKVKDIVDLIAKCQLPIIVYTGNEENVPEIFERINTQGIKLSKYQTFAASWTDYFVNIPNTDIKKGIAAKYKAMVSAGFIVSDLDDLDADLPNYNLFEYLFGLGKVLSEKFPLLFPKYSDGDELAPMAFVMTTIAHQLKTSQMSTLGKFLKARAGSDLIDLSTFEYALMDSCEEVQKSLQQYVKIKLNAVSDTSRFLAHSENQIYSLVLRVLISKYDVNDNWNLRSNSDYEEVLKNVPKYYLLDVLNGEWAGSGDSRLWNMCWIEDENNPGILALSSHYLVKPTKEIWSLTLDNWHQKELSKLQTKRVSISLDSKLLMKYLYSGIVTVGDDAGLTFQIEHLYPVKTLVGLIDKTQSKEGWPISAMGNLAILTQEVNNSKKDKMLGDFKLLPDGKLLGAQKWDRIQHWVITPEISKISYNEKITKIEFIEFCKLRFEEVKKILINTVGN